MVVEGRVLFGFAGNRPDPGEVESAGPTVEPEVRLVIEVRGFRVLSLLQMDAPPSPWPLAPVEL